MGKRRYSTSLLTGRRGFPYAGCGCLTRCLACGTPLKKHVTAKNCDRGQPVLRNGKPAPLTIPALIQYDDLYARPETHYATDKATLVQRD